MLFFRLDKKRKLDTLRLKYEKFTAQDFHDYYTYISNPDVMKYIGSEALSVEEAHEKFQKLLSINKKSNGYGFFRAVLKSNDKFIGLAKFDRMDKRQVEVGYALLPEFWGTGYASEMLEGMVQYAKRLGLQELLGLVNPGNPASIKVLTKQKFKLYNRGFINDIPTEYFKLNI